MPLTIRVSVAEKRSTTSQYENAVYGVDVEASGLELCSPEEIQHKTRELFQLARGAVQAQLLQPLPSEQALAERRAARENGANGSRPTNGLAPTNGRARNGHSKGNGSAHSEATRSPQRTQRRFGRPSPEASVAQKRLVKKLAAERNLDAETVGEICESLVGTTLRQCNRDDLSKLIKALLEEQVRG